MASHGNGNKQQGEGETPRHLERHTRYNIWSCHGSSPPFLHASHRSAPQQVGHGRAWAAPSASVAGLTPLAPDTTSYTQWHCPACCPRCRLTHSVIASPVFFAATAALYGFVLWQWEALPVIWQTFQSALLRGGLPNVAAFATLFMQPATTSLTWLHLLTLDLFQARWVYLDGLTSGVPTQHSAMLCFMVGPLGLLSHWITKQLVTSTSARQQQHAQQQHTQQQHTQQQLSGS
jgi:hypothetical protein